MRGRLNFVYKPTMGNRGSAGRQGQALLGGPSLNLILTSFVRLKQWDHDNLSAPYWRWYWNDKPGAAVRIGRVWTELTPDRIILLPPGTAFATRLTAPAGHLYCHFTASLPLAAGQQRAIVHTPDAAERAAVRRVARDFAAPDARHDHARGLAVQALTCGLLARLPATVWQSGPGDEDVARVLAFIHDRPASALDNAELARVAAVSVNTFLRRFRRFTGTTPHQYLTQVRLANAIAALLTTDHSIDRIAADCGFCDRYHLSRIFQRNVYVGPATYRKTAQERRSG